MMDFKNTCGEKRLDYGFEYMITIPGSIVSLIIRFDNYKRLM
jgi:hypothetical protein